MGELKKFLSDFKKAISIIIDICFQFSYEVEDKGDYYEFYSGGLSTLEDCFIFLIKQGIAEGDHLVIRIKKDIIKQFS